MGWKGAHRFCRKKPKPETVWRALIGKFTARKWNGRIVSPLLIGGIKNKPEVKGGQGCKILQMTDTQVFLGLTIAGKKRPEHPTVKMTEPLKCEAGKKIGSLSCLKKPQKFWGFFIALNFHWQFFRFLLKWEKGIKKSASVQEAKFNK